jgi:hypothetical protein
MNGNPSGSPRTDLLTQVLSMGQFDKHSGSSYSYDSCEVCKKKFKVEHEVIFHFPQKLTLSGADLPFDIRTETGKLCLPCLIVLGEALQAKNLEDILAYAKARYEKDKPKVYVPEVLAGDGGIKA